MSFTLTTSGAILWKAGANASTAITSSGAVLSKFSDDCEAVVNAATRKDWVADYSSVGANFRGILSDAVSDLAAMKIITYDMSGYTSRTEAQTMLDVLRDNFNRNIEILKDEKNKEKMD